MYIHGDQVKKEL